MFVCPLDIPYKLAVLADLGKSVRGNLYNHPLYNPLLSMYQLDTVLWINKYYNHGQVFTCLVFLVELIYHLASVSTPLVKQDNNSVLLKTNMKLELSPNVMMPSPPPICFDTGSKAIYVYKVVRKVCGHVV